MGKKEDYRVDEVVRLYEEGTTIAGIIEIVDMSYDRVLRLLRKKGVYKANKKTKEETSKERIYDLLKTEGDVMSVVEELKVPYLIVKSVAKEKSDTKKFAYRGKVFESYAELKLYKQKTGMEVKLLILEGKTKQEIAKMLGISLRAIAKFRK